MAFIFCAPVRIWKAMTATGTLRDGFVEGANTNALSEMANMMTAMRTFEAESERRSGIQDDRLGKVISRPIGQSHQLKPNFMLRALYSAATGMESQQLNLDVISNNLANVNTTGFKKSNIEFQDLLYDNVRAAGAETGNGNQLPTGLSVGHGTRAVATTKVFTEGELTQTGERLDIAIQGDGFLQVTMPDGTLAYTRDGSLKTNSLGTDYDGRRAARWPTDFSRFPRAQRRSQFPTPAR